SCAGQRPGRIARCGCRDVGLAAGAGGAPRARSDRADRGRPHPADQPAALMRRWLVTAAVAAAVATPVAVPAALAQPHVTGLRAGAASADITPPALGSLTTPDAATCAPVDGSGPFNGPRAFALEEPYADLNGNGVYDPPEPFLDCPTPTATGGIRPPDGRWDGIYLGGGDCCDR